MKKNIMFISAMLLSFALIGCGSSSKDEQPEQPAAQAEEDSKTGVENDEPGEAALEKEIEYSGDVSNIDMSEDWVGKHIVISGSVANVSSEYYSIEENGITVRAYFDDMRDDIQAGSAVTIDGVCTYEDSENLRLKLRYCTFVGEPPEEQVVSEPQTENTSDADTAASGKVVLTDDWYMQGVTFHNTDNASKLELVWYDNGPVFVAIDDLSLYSFFPDKYTTSSDGEAIFTSDDVKILYNPSAGTIKIDGGEYAGTYSSK